MQNKTNQFNWNGQLEWGDTPLIICLITKIVQLKIMSVLFVSLQPANILAYKMRQIIGFHYWNAIPHKIPTFLLQKQTFILIPYGWIFLPFIKYFAKNQQQ